ncbi:caspase family protein [Pseudodesulfovibrio sp. zrk46]|uniref:caspase family protein n=1 Tax=Pseudodesulfovibrio sp. zrk46 TaxID=2725288 RepID=UPI001449C5D6|nr:caspase family protein [Pseudodesulfovibrio sp. zrk46]QJB57057.1 caspase family protein [Pseudodesulfovibrio sp. zrk46]
MPAQQVFGRIAKCVTLLAILCIVLLVSGCVPPKESTYQTYEDPLELIGKSGVNPTAQYQSLKLGVIYSPNAENAMTYLDQSRQQYAAWGLNSYDKEPLINGIKKILVNRFNEVEQVMNLDDAMNKSCNLVMILDMKITAGQTSGNDTIIMIAGIFMDMDSSILGNVKSEARKRIPWPATLVYDDVVPEALKGFATNFDQSAPLAAKLADLERGPELAPVPQDAARYMATGDPRQRFALVIGNSSYKTGPLRNPVNDASDMARRLKEAGFNVTLLKNANQRLMEDAVHRLGTSLRKGGVGLFFYAGHAMQVDGSNYLIPIGAKIRSESDIRYEAVDLGRILGKMEDAGNSLNIVVLDACRNNPFARSFRSAAKGLAIMDAPTGSLIAYSTSPGDVAEDGTGRNGTYTKYLLRHLMTPGLTIEDVLKRVRIDVSQETNGRQIPWESSSLTGYFYFRKDE